MFGLNEGTDDNLMIDQGTLLWGGGVIIKVLPNIISIYCDMIVHLTRPTKIVLKPRGRDFKLFLKTTRGVP